MSGDPRYAPPLAWREAADASAAFDCGHRHPSGAGHLDETARRLSHEEMAAASVLVRDGHSVRSLPESRRGGRRPDLSVCGEPVEVKSFASLPDRRREPTPQSVFNKLVDAAGQAPHVVLVGAGSGLSSSTVRRGIARYVGGRHSVPPLSSVRVLGDGYDLAWSRGPVQRLGRPDRAPAERGLVL